MKLTTREPRAWDPARAPKSLVDRVKAYQVRHKLKKRNGTPGEETVDDMLLRLEDQEAEIVALRAQIPPDIPRRIPPPPPGLSRDELPGWLVVFLLAVPVLAIVVLGAAMLGGWRP